MEHAQPPLLVYKAWALCGPTGGCDDLQDATPVHAAIKAWPVTFRDQQMAVSGGTQYVRIGGHGSAVLLVHGFGDTGDMWVPLAEILVKDHTVIVPDLRGMGLSSHQDGGYEKTAQARDLASMSGSGRRCWLGLRTVRCKSDQVGCVHVPQRGAPRLGLGS